MPTPPRTYSPSAAEKLRGALLALAASAAAVASSAQDAGPAADFDEPDVVGEIPEDIVVGGDYMSTPCPKESRKSGDCFCEDACEEGKPCTDCYAPGGAEEPEPVAATAIRGEFPREPVSSATDPSPPGACSAPEAPDPDPDPVLPGLILPQGCAPD